MPALRLLRAGAAVSRPVSSEAPIRVEGLCKRFRDRQRGTFDAVSDLSFSCERGEIFGLLGPNGAGKTTALRLLATVLTPSAGRALVGGFDTRRQPKRVRAHIGFLSSDTGLYDRFTARETLRFFGRINRLGRRETDVRIAELSDWLGMADFLDRRVSGYSSGMRQKLSIARSLMHAPEVLIFDEPTAGLDVATARGVLDFVQSFRRRGGTVVLSTHVMRVAETACDRIGIIHAGRLRALGTLAELRTAHGRHDLEDIFFEVTG